MARAHRGQEGQVWLFRVDQDDDRTLGVPGAATGCLARPKGVVMRTALHVRGPDKLPARDGPIAASVKPAARFGLHLMQMCVAMCISLGVLAALFFGAAAVLGFSTRVWEDAPAVSVLVVSAVLAASMVVWMRFMGMDWRPTLEMAGTAIAAGAVVLTGYWFGIVPLKDLLTSVCGVACLAMIGVMLLRVRLYSGHHEHAR